MLAGNKRKKRVGEGGENSSIKEKKGVVRILQNKPSSLFIIFLTHVAALFPLPLLLPLLLLVLLSWDPAARVTE